MPLKHVGEFVGDKTVANKALADMRAQSKGLDKARGVKQLETLLVEAREAITALQEEKVLLQDSLASREERIEALLQDQADARAELSGYRAAERTQKSTGESDETVPQDTDNI